MKKLELCDYQRRAIDFGFKNKSTYMAVDMSLGKTAIALKWFEKIRKTYKNSMIVFAPIRVCYVTWPEEIAKWTPQFTYQILHGPHKNTKIDRKADIYLINYDGLKWFHSMMAKPRNSWRRSHVVFDESSFVKSPSTQRFKILKKLMTLFTPYRMCLSATPASKGYHNLWSQYFLLDQGGTLDTAFYRFRNRFFHYTGPPIYQTTLRRGGAKDIQKLIAPKTFRLEAKDYITLPKLINNIIKVPMDEKLTKMYKSLEKDFFIEFNDKTINALSAATLSIKLRQFIQGGLYTNVARVEYEKIHELKIDTLKELLESLNGSPILCPLQFKFEYDMLCKAFKKEIPIISGGTSTKDSIKFIKQWNRGDLELLLCHPASISHGLNLQASGYNLCWFSLTWSLEQYKQLVGRIYRRGQKHAVTVHHILLKDTIDEHIVKVLNKNNAVQEDLLKALKTYQRRIL